MRLSRLVMVIHYSLMLIIVCSYAGKSTFLRQNALIAILAQAGSFVPALNASIGMYIVTSFRRHFFMISILKKKTKQANKNNKTRGPVS